MKTTTYIKPHSSGTFKRSDIGDCAVRALSNCADYDYALADSVFRREGYDPIEGAAWEAIQKILPSHGFKLVDFSGGIGVSVLHTVYPTGVYYVLVWGHAFCLKNGAIIDLPRTMPEHTETLQVWQYATDL